MARCTAYLGAMLYLCETLLDGHLWSPLGASHAPDERTREKERVCSISRDLV